MTKIISTLEIFRNELLIETFQYISTHNLFNTFYHLNSRFHSLINSFKRLHLVLDEDWDNKQAFIPLFASHITILLRVDQKFWPW
jgi:hypothetical protein